MALGNFKGMFAASAVLLSGFFGGSTSSASGEAGCVTAAAVGTSWTTDFRHFFRWFGLGAFDLEVVFPMSANGFLLTPFSTVCSPCISDSALSSNAAPCIARSPFCSTPSPTEPFSSLAGSGFLKSSTTSLFSASLLLHLLDEQPHDVEQLPPEARHSHFRVLHDDCLLHVQQTAGLDSSFFEVTVSAEPSVFRLLPSSVSNE
uniref:Secreted protein n=1 Tax=Opuntia streptacantha TaxID=393608 RepID=A0A7C9ES49_OPUST